MIAKRLIASRLQPTCSRLHTRAGTSRRASVEWPSRPKRCIEFVDEAAAKPLDAGPGDHRSIIGAQSRRRRNKAQSGVFGKARKTPSQPLVGGNTAGNH
jgi:hypothetical protein